MGGNSVALGNSMERPLLVLVLLKTVLSQDFVSVHLPQLGAIRGSTSTSLWSRTTIYQFQGIPYAKPPSNDLRFKEPVPPDPWEGELDATHFKRQCPQIISEQDMADIKSRMEFEDLEDCLHLNVYTVQIPGKCTKKMPVMFYIHGGSFRQGSAKDFRPNYLLEEDVVLVVIQYRLGPLGFLSLQNDDISGNMGLLDQLLALEWVNKHISSFCGDPDQVTIFGQSSGAAAVSLMIVSPLANEKLFNKAIIQSGSSFCQWAVDYNPVENAKNISRLANCSTEVDSELYACLKNLNVYEILIAHSNFLSNVLDKYEEVITVSGGNHAVIQTAGKKRFLTEDPRKSYALKKYMKIPTMIGVTKDEGSFIVGNVYDFLLDGNITGKEEMLRDMLVESAVKFSGIKDPSGLITDIFTKQFFKEEDLGNFMAMVPGLVDLCGSALLKSCVLKQARQNFKDGNTYLYTFNYRGHLTKFGYGVEVNFPFSGGVAHSDDLIYLFPHKDGNLTQSEMQIAKTVVELWTNFAKNGKPVPATNVNNWPPMVNQDGPYLIIDKVPHIGTSFVDQYTVTIREGLDTDAAAIKHTSLAILFAIVIIQAIELF
ncbi:fatty acyl-CoA hydrolase precursor, medium chain-like [Cimex lectularius]|uniref:Carboxylesterase type B domain-containing protein n=1 Tax=Cimex lectularius TaxID=79782 RepID=A0A8I6RX77_CIMLE|nr:fatty acyl-CoA hydrolase precursor, medium chain-like [Cimex lectularius]